MKRGNQINLIKERLLPNAEQLVLKLLRTSLTSAGLAMVTACLVGGAGTGSAVAQSSCGLTVTVQSKTARATKTKCGTPGGCATTVPPKFFMKKQLDCRHTCTYTDAQTRNSASVQTRQTIVYDPDSCQSAETYSGTASSTSTANPQSNCTATQSANGAWDNHACAAQIILFLESMLKNVTYQTTQCSIDTHCVEYHHTDQSQSSTTQVDSVETTTWSDEYTDEMLRSAITAAMPSLDGPLSDGPASAYYALDAIHYEGIGQKMRYRLKLSGTQAGTTYKLSWQEVTVYADGSSTAKSFQEYVTASGPESFSSDHYIDPPSWDGRGTEEGVAKTTVQNIAAPEIVSSALAGGSGGGQGASAGTGQEPGSGGVCDGDSSGTGGSSSGPALCFRGPCNPNRGPCNSVSLKVSMGTAAFGVPAGEIYMSEQMPSVDLARPTALRFSGTSPDVEVIRTDGVLRQLKAPQALAHIQPINQFKYQILFYRPSDVGPRIGDSYQIINPTNWFANWTIENPAQSTNSVNSLKITHARPGHSEVFLYTYNPQTATWSLDHPGNLRKDQWQVIDDSLAQTRHQISSVCSSDGSIALKTTATYKRFSWGEALVQSTTGDGNCCRTTTQIFYDPPPFSPNGTRLPLKLVIPADGPWQRFDSYDSLGRPLIVVSQFLGAPTNAPESLCHATHYDYTPLPGSGDDGSQPDLPRTTVHYLLGREIARTYTIIRPGQTLQIQCQSPGADWTAPDNLVTVRTFYTNGAFSNYLRSIDNPDGTRKVFFYSRSGSDQNVTQTTTILSGQPDPTNQTNIVSGTITTTVVGHIGQTLSRTVQQFPSMILLSRETYSYLDQFHRSYTVTYLNGRTETHQFGCCGPDIWIDTDGRITQYMYDAMGRQIGSTILSFDPPLTTTNHLDPAGHTLRTVRTANGSAIRISESAYNSAGELIAQTNALGGVTTYTQSTDPTGYRTRTTVYPDGSTRIELYYPDGQLAKLTGTAVSPLRYEYGVEQDNGVWRQFSRQIKLDSNFTDTPEWTKSYTDMLGRNYKTVFAAATTPYPYQQSFYNNRGQLWKQRDPDGVVTLYAYDPLGELALTAIDINRNDQIDLAGSDRITWTTNDVTTFSGAYVRRSRTFQLTTNGATNAALVSMTMTDTAGLRSWSVVYRDSSTPVTTRTETAYGSNGSRVVTTIAPNGSSLSRTFSFGRLVSETRRDVAGNSIGTTTYSYDWHGRLASTTDSNNGTTAYTYNNADQICSTTTPCPGSGQPPLVTLTFYDAMGRVTGAQLPDGSTTTNLYYPTGLLKRTSGSGIYPVEYTYDAQGRIRTMKTWQSVSTDSGIAITRWNYDLYRGWLKSKDYPDATTGVPPAQEGSSGPVYGYTQGGRLAARIWKRGVTTSYIYNNAGDLQKIDYSDSTPDVTYGYDRRGRRTVATCNGTTTIWTYNDANLPLTESYSGGTLSGLSMNWSYDANLRLATVTGRRGASVIQTAAYSYDSAGRIQSVTDGPCTVTYRYQPESALIDTITFANNGTARLVTSRSYDKLNRLVEITSVPSGSSPVSFRYQYNSANQRTRVSMSDGSYWEYRYDELGQVVWGKRYWSDGTPVAGQQFEYSFDHIGNRTGGATGGDENGGGLRFATYTVNRLNQYSSRTVPGYVDVIGIANPTAPVSVNGNSASRKGEYFHHALQVPNQTAQYPTVTVVSGYGAGQTNSGRLYVPAETEHFTYDADGNLRSDGRWTYSWDGENRLVEMVRDSDSPSGARQKLVFEYDHEGRRVRKQFYTYSGGWVKQADTIFLWDGWNPVAELDGRAGGVPVRSYVWGSDLSGSMQGAGGVGGLLKMTCYGASTTNAFVVYDGNGNVMGLVDASNGLVCARYEYGPFAEPIRVSGPLATLNPIRYSTKYTDTESGLLYYGYRYYNPSTGRWISRDPIGEDGGGINLYCFVANDTQIHLDPLGLQPCRKLGKIGWAYSANIATGVYAGWDASGDIEMCGCCYTASIQIGVEVAIGAKYRRQGKATVNIPNVGPVGVYFGLDATFSLAQQRTHASTVVNWCPGEIVVDGKLYLVDLDLGPKVGLSVFGGGQIGDNVKLKVSGAAKATFAANVRAGLEVVSAGSGFSVYVIGSATFDSTVQAGFTVAWQIGSWTSPDWLDLGEFNWSVFGKPVGFEEQRLGRLIRFP